LEFTTNEEIISLLGREDGVDSSHLVILSVPSDGTVTLVEADNATLASVATHQIENRRSLRVFNHKDGLFLI
jgi:hypothetical protein